MRAPVSWIRELVELPEDVTTEHMAARLTMLGLKLEALEQGVVMVTTSNFGTGGGRAGAIVALVLGLLAVALGVMALTRSRRAI